jgi:hypothetical protein
MRMDAVVVLDATVITGSVATCAVAVEVCVTLLRLMYVDVAGVVVIAIGVNAVGIVVDELLSS